MGKCMNIWHGKEMYLWIHLIVDFMDLWYYLEILKMFCLKLYYLGNWCKIFLTRNGFEEFENIVNIWLLKYLMKLLGSKLCIWIHLTCVLLMRVCPCAMMLVITPSLWQRLCDVWLPHLCDMWLPRLHDDKPSWRLPLCMTWVNPWVCGWGYYP